MTKLRQLFDEHGQSPWLDNLTRTYLRDGSLARFVDDGIRGVTANPTIFAKAIEGSDAYDEQFGELTAAGVSVNDAYWELVIGDVMDALRVLRPVHDASGGSDGLVSIEVAPELARDTEGSIAAARDLHGRIDQPNLFVKIPATAEGIPAIQAMTAEGHSINITLIFLLSRYREVIEAYLSGLEAHARAGGDLSQVHSVASFFVSRVDTEVDRRLDAIGTPACFRRKSIPPPAPTWATIPKRSPMRPPSKPPSPSATPDRRCLSRCLSRWYTSDLDGLHGRIARQSTTSAHCSHLVGRSASDS